MLKDMSERSGTTERISSYKAKFLLFVVLLEPYILNCQRLIGRRPSCFLSTVVPIIVVRGKTVVRLDRCVVPVCHLGQNNHRVLVTISLTDFWSPFL